MSFTPASIALCGERGLLPAKAEAEAEAETETRPA
jgi:hypothetical protein